MITAVQSQNGMTTVQLQGNRLDASVAEGVKSDIKKVIDGGERQLVIDLPKRADKCRRPLLAFRAKEGVGEADCIGQEVPPLLPHLACIEEDKAVGPHIAEP